MGDAPAAYMRNTLVDPDERADLDIYPDVTSATCIAVPGFGVVLVGRPASWRALLVQPDAEHKYSPASNHVDLAAREVDRTVEVDLLVNGDGRGLVIVVEGLL